MKQKRGQLKISFGMIFSIILVVVFLAFAFLAIQKFLNFQKDVTAKKFYEGLNKDVEKVWTSTQASKKIVYFVPRGTKKVCFKDNSSENVYFYEERPKPGEFIKYLKVEDDFCTKVIKGRATFILEKNYGDNFVKVRKI